MGGVSVSIFRPLRVRGWLRRGATTLRSPFTWTLLDLGWHEGSGGQEENERG